MKKIDKFWYWFLIVVAIVICFMFGTTKVNAAGEVIDPDTGGNVVVPGDGVTDTPSIGDITFEQCYDYITTNIISAESLEEALAGKVYGNSQEDCMEMINIASKKEVIKNIVSIYDRDEINFNGITYSVSNNIINLNGIPNGGGVGIKFYSSTKTFETGNYKLSFKVHEGTASRLNDQWLFLVHFMNNNTPVSSVQIYNLNSKPDVWLDSNVTNMQIWIGYTNDLGAFASFDNLKIELQIEKGSTATRFVSYDYHREYYEEGYNYALNTNLEEASELMEKLKKTIIEEYVPGDYTNDLIIEDMEYYTCKINWDKKIYCGYDILAEDVANANYASGFEDGIEKGYKESLEDEKAFLGLIPTILGAVVSNLLPIFTYEVYGISIMNLIGLIAVVGLAIIIVKFILG